MTMFPSLADTTSAEEALKEARQRAGVLKASAAFLREEAQSRGLPTDLLLGKFLGDLNAHRARLVQIRAHPQLDSLADQLGFDVTAGLSAVIARCDDLIAGLAIDLPCDGDGWLQVQRLEAGQLVARHLLPDQLSGLIARLQALEAVIG